MVRLFFNLNVVTEEKGEGKKAKSQKVKEDLKSALTDPQMSGLGGLMAKEKDIKIFFIQPDPLVSPRNDLFRSPTNTFLILIWVSSVKHFFKNH